MFNWAKQTLAQTLGTEEPIYGPSAIKSVAEDSAKTPYTELARNDLKWEAMTSTSVETQSFYFMADSGHLGLAQVIYSNVAGIHTTCQFNSKIFYVDRTKPHLYCSTQLSDTSFSDDKLDFFAKDCALQLSEDGNSYTIKSMTDQRCIVNLKVTKTAPGFVAGKNGKTLFGTDLAHPWGSMRHAFWPRCVAEGTMLTKDGPVDFKGKAFFTHALQGMKPHHAAARWNFVDFQGPTYSAIMMEFTTPPSYGSTIVGVGGIAKDGEIITAGAGENTVKALHAKATTDPDTQWPEPKEVKFSWNGTTKDGKSVEAVLETPLEERQDRVDIMAEVPAFVKKIIAGTAGTRPYIYQCSPRTTPVTLKMKIGDEVVSEQGILFTEATFLSGTKDANEATKS
ncbi:survival factor 1 [Pseudomassariella vexata]|uniref:Survival factor 1 n=1 Tax=Pseudomassariella vexata TaxID=1141098 RepID=A0A1Y2E0H5_9PEZI|nr:survival factor 1 [Pseudomassariella vexata]ORY65048.1 survival factor 1 [Pseudomassariella vexata]